jgi:hypothetical protein
MSIKKTFVDAPPMPIHLPESTSEVFMYQPAAVIVDVRCGLNVVVNCDEEYPLQGGVFHAG